MEKAAASTVLRINLGASVTQVETAYRKRRDEVQKRFGVARDVNTQRRRDIEKAALEEARKILLTETEDLTIETAPSEGKAPLAEHEAASVKRGKLPGESEDPPVESVSRPMDRVFEPIERVSSPIERVSELIERTSSPIERVSEPIERASSPIERVSEPIERASSSIGRVSEPVKCARLPSSTRCVRDRFSSYSTKEH
jgi:hypothetical protein